MTLDKFLSILIDVIIIRFLITNNLVDKLLDQTAEDVISLGKFIGRKAAAFGRYITSIFKKG